MDRIRIAGPRRTIAAFLAAIALIHAQIPLWADTLGQQPSTIVRSTPSHYPEPGRLAIGSLVIIPASGKTDLDIGGDYSARESLYNSAYMGQWYGSQIGILLCVGLLLCMIDPDLFWFAGIAEYAGVAIGLSKAEIQNRIQAFRDQLARSIRKSALPSLTTIDLPATIYTQIRKFDYTHTRVVHEYAALPDDAETMLIVSLDGLEIATDGKFAAITAQARAVLRDVKSREDLWSDTYTYSDFDTLEAWSEDDNKAVDKFLIFAEHYFAQRIAQDVLLLVQLRHVLRPTATETTTVAGPVDWQGQASSETPTLGWELLLLGNDPYGSWTTQLNESDVSYDLQIFDGHRLAYEAGDIAQPEHRVILPLPDCRSLRWSVRPRYHFDGHTRVGLWMRYHANPAVDAATSGTNASVEPSYVNGFARLATPCSN